MTATYDLTTDVGRVRLLIGDTMLDEPMFSDEELTAFVTLEGSVYRGAALALDTIAVSETLIEKVVTILDLTTNGPAVSASLRENAQRLRELDANEVVFDIAQMPLTPSNIMEGYVKTNWPLL